jgi:hypothetical protein
MNQIQRVLSVSIRWVCFAVIAVCLFGGVVSLRRGDMSYSLWIMSSCWPAVLVLVIQFALRKLAARRTQT